jgi:hypothetical protein
MCAPGGGSGMSFAASDLRRLMVTGATEPGTVWAMGALN